LLSVPRDEGEVGVVGEAFLLGHVATQGQGYKAMLLGNVNKNGNKREKKIRKRIFSTPCSDIVL
jgi:hypothetical protein